MSDEDEPLFTGAAAPHHAAGGDVVAASVHGVVITPAIAAACRELLAGVASAEAWQELAPLVVESERVFTGVSPESDGDGKKHPPFGELYTVRASLHALASCALGTACARCSTPIEDEGAELDDGWCCSWCAERQRAIDAFRRHAATWLRRRGEQLDLFGAAPARTRRRRPA